MKIQICLDRQELHGLQAAKFEVYDSNDVNQGALFVGKGGIRWQEPKQPGGRARSKGHYKKCTYSIQTFSCSYSSEK